jgi:hypothetical protein
MGPFKSVEEMFGVLWALTVVVALMMGYIIGRGRVYAPIQQYPHPHAMQPQQPTIIYVQPPVPTQQPQIVRP